METIYDVMLFSIVLCGIVSGTYVVWRAFHHTNDMVLFCDLFVLGISNLSVSFVYMYMLVYQPEYVLLAANKMGAYLRPLNLIILSVPALVIGRIGL